MTANNEAGGTGAVAIHRWFADGEGWAYHPWYAGRMSELLIALKDELQMRSGLETSGGRRQFLQYAMGGVLFGEQVSDPSCPDEAARGRYPTILRAVFLRSVPTEVERLSLAEGLTRLDPECTGPDAGLCIRLSEETALIPKARSANTRVTVRVKEAAADPGPKGRRRAVFYFVSIAFVLAGSAFAWFQFLQLTPKPNNDELQRAQVKMTKLMKKWNADKDSESVLNTADRFLTFLSRDDLGRLAGRHPDTRFVERLPTRDPGPQSLGWSRSRLESLDRHLARTDPASQSIKAPTRGDSLDDILDRIDGQMDYSRWWFERGGHEGFVATEKADEKVTEFARRFVARRSVDATNRGWQEPVAKKMLSLLRDSWHVESVEKFSDVDCDKRPWLVFCCFFQFLSQRQFERGDLLENAYQVEFIKRLPEKPVTEDGDFATEEKLVDALRMVAQGLNAGKSDNASTLLANISGKLNYDDWRLIAPDVKVCETEKGSPAVDKFVSRFCQKPQTQEAGRDDKAPR